MQAAVPAAEHPLPLALQVVVGGWVGTLLLRLTLDHVRQGPQLGTTLVADTELAGVTAGDGVAHDGHLRGSGCGRGSVGVSSVVVGTVRLLPLHVSQERVGRRPVEPAPPEGFANSQQ